MIIRLSLFGIRGTRICRLVLPSLCSFPKPEFGKEVPKENFVPKEYPSEIFVARGRVLLRRYYYPDWAIYQN